ncbi:MAG: ribosome maturation factor RimM [Terracidiphilus sp.]
MTAADPQAGWVWLARIRRPQGRKGEVFAEILTDFPEKFAERRRLWLLSEKAAAEPLPAELTAFWLHKGGVVLQFAAVDSISEAETLAGLIVAIPLAARAAPQPNAIHIADLIGCTVVDVAAELPRVLGKIENVERPAGAAPILIVRSPGGEVLIPFAQSYLRKLDPDNRRIEMALPEGLADLNAPHA